MPSFYLCFVFAETLQVYVVRLTPEVQWSIVLAKGDRGQALQCQHPAGETLLRVF